MACDHPTESFAQIAKRAALRSFGKSKTAVVLQKEARKMFNNAR